MGLGWSTVPVENNQVTAENDNLLVEIQKIRSELLVATEQIKENQEEIIQKLESKTELEFKDANIKNLYEISNKLQSIEALISKTLKSNNTTKVASEKRFKLKHVFENVNAFEENVSNFSEREDHYNVNWWMNVKRHKNHLSFYVWCEPIAPKGEWSIQTKFEFKVVGRNQNDAIETGKSCYQDNEGLGFHEFLDWEEMKKSYLVNGNLTVEVHGEIVKTIGLQREKIRMFDESQKDVSDVILVVRDTKFYVLKMFLAAQSPVFEALLLGNFSESKETEVKLNGIEPVDFHYFLEVLYGESAIDDSNIESIALLADLYDAPTAIRRCEDFLLEKSKKTLKKKLGIATRYNLKTLQEKCMKEAWIIPQTDISG